MTKCHIDSVQVVNFTKNKSFRSEGQFNSPLKVFCWIKSVFSEQKNTKSKGKFPKISDSWFLFVKMVLQGFMNLHHINFILLNRSQQRFFSSQKIVFRSERFIRNPANLQFFKENPERISIRNTFANISWKCLKRDEIRNWKPFSRPTRKTYQLCAQRIQPWQPCAMVSYYNQLGRMSRNLVI